MDQKTKQMMKLKIESASDLCKQIFTNVKVKQKRSQKKIEVLFIYEDEEVFFKSPSISFNFQRQPVKKWA